MTRRTPDDKRRRILAASDDPEGLTQADIASRFGLNRCTVSRIEHQAGKGRRRRRSFADAATGFGTAQPKPKR